MNVVRSTYRKLSEAEAANVQLVKRAGQTLIETILQAYGPRDRGVNPYATTPRNAACNEALTKAQEAVMWAVYGLTG